MFSFVCGPQYHVFSVSLDIFPADFFTCKHAILIKLLVIVFTNSMRFPGIVFMFHVSKLRLLPRLTSLPAFVQKYARTLHCLTPHQSANAAHWFRATPQPTLCSSLHAGCTLLVGDVLALTFILVS